MKNPLGNDGILTRIIPWISIAIATVLAAATFSGNSSVTVKTVATIAAAAIITRCTYLIMDRKRPARRG